MSPWTFCLLLPTSTSWFSLLRKWQSHKQSRTEMEMFWFFRLWFCHAYDSTCDSNVWLSLGHRCSNDSAYDPDSDSVTSLVKTSFKCPNVTLPLSPLTLLWVCHGFVSLLDTQYFFVILATCPIYIFLKQRLLFFLSNYNTILSWLPHSNPRSSSDFLNLNSPSFPRTWCLLY